MAGAHLGDDSELGELPGRGAGEVAVRGGGGRGRMQDFPQLMGVVFYGGQLLFGEGSDADEFVGLEDFDDAGEMRKAGLFNRLHGVAGKFVRGKIGSGVLHPDEGAKVGDEVIFEELIGRLVEVGKESPEPAAGDLGAFAVETGDRPFRVFGVGLFNRSRDAHPVTDVGDFAKGHAGLGHAVGAGVHSEKEDLLLTAAKSGEVVAMTIPGVFERVVSVSDGIGKGEATEFPAEIIGGGNQRMFAHGVGACSSDQRPTETSSSFIRSSAF